MSTEEERRQTEEERDLQTRADVLALRWSVDRLEHTMADVAKNLADAVAKMDETYVRKDVYTGDQRAVWDKVKEHAGWLLWAQRIVMLAVATALLALVLS